MKELKKTKISKVKVPDKILKIIKEEECENFEKVNQAVFYQPVEKLDIFDNLSKSSEAETVMMENENYHKNNPKRSTYVAPVKNMKAEKLFDRSGKYLIVKVQSDRPMTLALWQNCFCNSHYTGGYSLLTYFPKYKFPKRKFYKNMIGIYNCGGCYGPDNVIIDPSEGMYMCINPDESNFNYNRINNDGDIKEEAYDRLKNGLVVTNHNSCPKIKIKKISIKNVGDVKGANHKLTNRDRKKIVKGKFWKFINKIKSWFKSSQRYS